MVLAGCGSSTETVSAGQSTGHEESSPTSEVVSESTQSSESEGDQQGTIQTIPAPEAEPVEEREAPGRPGIGNANRRNASPIESLCWANREVSRLILRLAIVPDVDHSRADRAIIDDLSRSAPAILEVLDEVGGELPPDVLPFAERLRSEVETAVELAEDRSVGPLEVFSGFDYDDWPAAEAYANHAKRSAQGLVDVRV